MRSHSDPSNLQSVTGVMEGFSIAIHAAIVAMVLRPVSTGCWLIVIRERSDVGSRGRAGAV